MTNIVEYAHQVDKELAPAFIRSQLSQTAKDVQDKLIIAHFSAGSTVSEAAAIIRSVLKTLET